MSKYRQAARIDANQPEIVEALRKIPGVTVEVGHDDIFIGHKKKNYWIELKTEDAVSKQTGEILESQIKDSQKDLRDDWSGHYAICWNLEQILKEMGIGNATSK